MTQVPATTGGGNVPVNIGDYQFASTGLEDFSVSDAVLPRIKIDHENGEWVTNDGFRTPVLRFIALGLVKQRVLFHHIVDNDDVPMCKSSDFQVGYPNPDAPQSKSFPWELSGFSPADFPPDAEGNVKLPCSGCALKDWGSSPVGDSPYCSEQWTLPIYYDSSPNEAGEWVPAILTLQKSSIKPIRTYFTSFAQSNRPPFLATGRATLQVRTRGSVKYSVPSFSKDGESPRENWMEYAEQFNEMRAYLTRPPVREDSEGAPAAAAPQSNVYTGPAQPQVQQPVQPQVQQPVQPQVQQPVQTQGDPWAAPAPAAANPGDPWGQQPQTPQAPVQSQVQPEPVQQAPVQPQPAPVAQPQVQPQPPVQQAPPVQPQPEAAAQPDNNDLPF